MRFQFQEWFIRVGLQFVGIPSPWELDHNHMTSQQSGSLFCLTLWGKIWLKTRLEGLRVGHGACRFLMFITT